MKAGPTLKMIPCTLRQYLDNPPAAREHVAIHIEENDMNSNFFQTILTILITVSGLATSALLSLGCKDIAGTLNCATSSAPSWLAPYLVVIASALGFTKLIIAAFTGKLVAPTVVVSKSGAPGTVSPTFVTPK
jgi:hypothetical protein